MQGLSFSYFPLNPLLILDRALWTFTSHQSSRAGECPGGRSTYGTAKPLTNYKVYRVRERGEGRGKRGEGRGERGEGRGERGEGRGEGGGRRREGGGREEGGRQGGGRGEMGDGRWEMGEGRGRGEGGGRREEGSVFCKIYILF